MIYILDEDFKKIDILRKFTFWQYVRKARDIGTFEIDIPIATEQKYLLDKTKTYFVLFDDEVFGKIQSVKYSSDSETDAGIVIGGQLSLYILQKRVIDGTINFSGKTCDYIKALIEGYISKNTRSGAINVTVEYALPDEIQSRCSKIDRQTTGGTVWEEIQEVCEIDKLCVDLVPVVGVSTDESPENIKSWKFVISPGAERTKGNSYGNNPVVFSQSLSNIHGVDYSYNTESYTNVAYVASEGEGTDRRWYRINREGNITNPWLREELWIDARDIQSVQPDGTELSNEEYEALINQRAFEKFAENDIEESYESTLVPRTDFEVYGKDYILGDFVTVQDKELEVEMNAQITSVTVSEKSSRRIIDPGFTYGNITDPINKINSTATKVEQVQTDVKYLESKVGDSKTSLELLEEKVNELAERVKDLELIGY